MKKEKEILSTIEVKNLFMELKKLNPNPKGELKYTDIFSLLIAVVLSAQATDKSVNLATKNLFDKARSPKDFLKLGESKLIQYIKNIGLYRAKAKNIIKLCEMLIADFNEIVPDTREKLMLLPGVGRKTANVVLNIAFKQPTMAVDTHVYRVSRRTGLSSGDSVLDVEEDLVNNIPTDYILNAHHWLILHGRYVCKSRKPLCSECVINNICKKNF